MAMNDAAPQQLRIEDDDFLSEEVLALRQRIEAYKSAKRISICERIEHMVSTQRIGVGTMKASLDDIVRRINENKFMLDEHREAAAQESFGATPRPHAKSSPYIKVVLRNTEDMLLFEQRSCTALRDSEEGERVVEENAAYEYLTLGKGRYRRIRDAETQTENALFKTRSVNTRAIVKESVASYVSNFEMFDTYMALQSSTKSIDMNGEQKLKITTYTVAGIDRFDEIYMRPNFKLAMMITMRILAGNTFEQQQRRFRNMQPPDPLADHIDYKYRLALLWPFRAKMVYTHSTHVTEMLALADVDANSNGDGNDLRNGNGNATGHVSANGKSTEWLGSVGAVTDLSWCPANGDILAVAYGIYSHSVLDAIPEHGAVCVWSIKNPVNPERNYAYNLPVSALAFSANMPQLLAIGFYDGSVEVRDITHFDHRPLAVSQRLTSPCYEPITAIQWLPPRSRLRRHRQSSCDSDNSEMLLALGRDGSVTRYQLLNGQHLIGSPQLQLKRIEGNVPGLQVRSTSNQLERARAIGQPQGLSLILHPQQRYIFYVTTDEGCLHKCSTNFPHQQLAISRAHTAGINMLEYSPWSPTLYLTCGNDWCVRIWMDDIVEPLITLHHQMRPVHSACWSRTHSTIIVAVTRDSIDIWDIRRSTLKPVSTTATNDMEDTPNTLGQQSNCGRCFCVGKESGNVLMLAFEDMPFPPHYQYKELRKALRAAVANDPKLSSQLQALGHFGYRKPNKATDAGTDAAATTSHN